MKMIQLHWLPINKEVLLVPILLISAIKNGKLPKIYRNQVSF